MSNQLPRDEVLAILNDYFDAVTGPSCAGGEILKFIGDSVLAIFPMKGRPLPRRKMPHRADAGGGSARSHARRQRTARQRRKGR